MRAGGRNHLAGAAVLSAMLFASPIAAAPAKTPPAAPSPAPEAPPEPQPPLLGFCASPVQPACLDNASAYAAPRDRAACDADMQRYVRSVFAYRVCLNAEMERAVRAVNGAIQRHRCRMGGGKKC